jgi:hypothetical protein
MFPNISTKSETIFCATDNRVKLAKVFPPCKFLRQLKRLQVGLEPTQAEHLTVHKKPYLGHSRLVYSLSSNKKFIITLTSGFNDKKCFLLYKFCKIS